MQISLNSIQSWLVTCSIKQWLTNPKIKYCLFIISLRPPWSKWKHIWPILTPKFPTSNQSLPKTAPSPPSLTMTNLHASSSKTWVAKKSWIWSMLQTLWIYLYYRIAVAVLLQFIWNRELSLMPKNSTIKKTMFCSSLILVMSNLIKKYKRYGLKSEEKWHVNI